MEDLKKEWAKKVPKYANSNKDLFKRLSEKYGAEGDKLIGRGKSFANNYELYLYAFFLGLYAGAKEPIAEDETRVDFGHPIDKWGNKTNRIDRKDFSELQDYVFMALVVETNFDMQALEKGKITSASVTKKLITTMESYANGGLQIIREKLEDIPNYQLQPTAWLDLVSTYAKVEEPPVG